MKSIGSDNDLFQRRSLSRSVCGSLKKLPSLNNNSVKLRRYCEQMFILRYEFHFFVNQFLRHLNTAHLKKVRLVSFLYSNPIMSDGLSFTEPKAQKREKTETKEEQKIREMFSDYNPENIWKKVHPMEGNPLLGVKGLSDIQKAITCCMLEMGGTATSDEILAFIRRFWTAIESRSVRPYKSIPDKRIIHVAFSNKRSGVRLFVPIEVNGERKYGLNYPDGHCEDQVEPQEVEEEENVEIEHALELQIPTGKMRFEERLLKTIQSARSGARAEDLVQVALDYSDDEGPFSHLNGIYRVRATLILLKEKGLLKRTVDDWGVQRWSCAPDDGMDAGYQEFKEEPVETESIHELMRCGCDFMNALSMKLTRRVNLVV